ncbi:MAG: hypothetical protein SVG88_08020 [Halobacteriales archaeon]|nr:hypothetical protein [Halobacteriales archaeon]
MQPNDDPDPSGNDQGYTPEIDEETKELVEEVKEEVPTFEPRDLDDETYIEQLVEQLQETFDVDEAAATRVAERACQAQNDDRFGGEPGEREETSGGALLSDPNYVVHHVKLASGDSLADRWNKCMDDWGFVHSVSVEEFLLE